MDHGAKWSAWSLDTGGVDTIRREELTRWWRGEIDGGKSERPPPLLTLDDGPPYGV